MAEPQLEELSAYLDHELTGAARQEIEAHLRDCETCRRRLEALNQTVAAIHELPVEAPPRAFTIPAQREQPLRWRPVAGWLGGAAAAALLAVVLVNGLAHREPSGTPALSLYAPLQNHGAAGAAAAPAPRAELDARSAFGNSSTSGDVAHGRYLTLSADQFVYPANGTMTVRVQVQGWPGASPPPTGDQAGLRLELVRNGVGVQLSPPPLVAASGNQLVYQRSYALRDLQLAPPVAGTYQLHATWVLPDGSGVVMEEQVTIQLTGSS